jgi:hypothetical protein
MTHDHEAYERLMRRYESQRKSGNDIRAADFLDAALNALTEHVWLQHPEITHADDADLYEQHTDSHSHDESEVTA